MKTIVLFVLLALFSLTAQADGHANEHGGNPPVLKSMAVALRQPANTVVQRQKTRHMTLRTTAPWSTVEKPPSLTSTAEKRHILKTVKG